MARASRIYNVFHGDKLLGSFTVKYEMVNWAKKYSGYGSAELKCFSTGDGKPESGFTEMPWEKEWEKPQSPAALLASKLAKQFIRNGQMGG